MCTLRSFPFLSRPQQSCIPAYQKPKELTDEVEQSCRNQKPITKCKCCWLAESVQIQWRHFFPAPRPLHCIEFAKQAGWFSKAATVEPGSWSSSGRARLTFQTTWSLLPSSTSLFARTSLSPLWIHFAPVCISVSKRQDPPGFFEQLDAYTTQRGGERVVRQEQRQNHFGALLTLCLRLMESLLMRLLQCSDQSDLSQDE